MQARNNFRPTREDRNFDEIDNQTITGRKYKFDFIRDPSGTHPLRIKVTSMRGIQGKGLKAVLNKQLRDSYESVKPFTVSFYDNEVFLVCLQNVKLRAIDFFDFINNLSNGSSICNPPSKLSIDWNKITYNIITNGEHIEGNTVNTVMEVKYANQVSKEEIGKIRNNIYQYLYAKMEKGRVIKKWECKSRLGVDKIDFTFVNELTDAIDRHMQNYLKQKRGNQNNNTLPTKTLSKTTDLPIVNENSEIFSQSSTAQIFKVTAPTVSNHSAISKSHNRIDHLNVAPTTVILPRANDTRAPHSNLNVEDDPFNQVLPNYLVFGCFKLNFDNSNNYTITVEENQNLEPTIGNRIT
ncbi:MAG: hypothetical protein H0W64_05510 [Gammaproteobacteria bacterium]|nr:hypothetical protein [Gammaproteobacteria bacterium]